MGYGRSVELPSEGKTPSEAKKRDGFSSMRLEHREQRERERREAGRAGRRRSGWLFGLYSVHNWGQR